MADIENKITTVKEAGRKGGEARAEQYSKDDLSEQARKAAQTVEREHPGFHSEIGKKGGQSRGEVPHNNEDRYYQDEYEEDE